MSSSYSGNDILKLAAATDDEAQKTDRLVAIGELLKLLRKLKTTVRRAPSHLETELVDDQVLLPMIDKTIHFVQTLPVADEKYNSWLQKADERIAQPPGLDKLEKRARDHINDIKLFHAIWGSQAALVLEGVSQAHLLYYSHPTTQLKFLTAIMKSRVCQKYQGVSQTQLSLKRRRRASEDVQLEEQQRRLHAAASIRESSHIAIQTSAKDVYKVHIPEVETPIYIPGRVVGRQFVTAAENEYGIYLPCESADETGCLLKLPIPIPNSTDKYEIHYAPTNKVINCLKFIVQLTDLNGRKYRKPPPFPSDRDTLYSFYRVRQDQVDDLPFPSLVKSIKVSEQWQAESELGNQEPREMTECLIVALKNASMPDTCLLIARVGV